MTQQGVYPIRDTPNMQNNHFNTILFNMLNKIDVTKVRRFLIQGQIRMMLAVPLPMITLVCGEMCYLTFACVP